MAELDAAARARIDAVIEAASSEGRSGLFEHEVYTVLEALGLTAPRFRFDRASRSLRWVRAGHPPALVYDPEADRFRELKGQGLPLGVDDQYQYEEYLDAEISTGQVIVIAPTDLEASDHQRNFYGMERFEVIRRHAPSAPGHSRSRLTDISLLPRCPPGRRRHPGGRQWANAANRPRTM
jgi:hypothetical protein